MSGELGLLPDAFATRIRLNCQHAGFDLRRDCRSCKETVDLSDRVKAIGWLERLSEGETGILRGLLAEFGYAQAAHLSSREVRDEIADLLVRKKLCVCRIAKHERTVARVPAGAPRPAQAAPPPPFPLAERRSRPSLAEPEPEPPAFGAGADLAGIANVLKNAAETGVPFCEECAKAAQRRAMAQQ